jgi:predicted transposase YbfD/YdcC
MKSNHAYPYFAEVEDPRVVGRCDHLLSDILLIALCVYITGGKDYQDMHLFAKERGKSMRPLLELPNGVPSADTFERVFRRLKPESLETALRNYREEIVQSLQEKQIIIDGKKLRGTSPRKHENKSLYLLNAWVGEHRLCLAQKRVEGKSNEITAIPKILDSLDISGAVVSIDAMGTQRKIAAQIREKSGHYFLAVKGNQRELFEEIQSAFKVSGGKLSAEEWEYGHGRYEERRCRILPAQKYLPEELVARWTDLSTLVKIESCRQIGDELTRETRYYISDEDNTAPEYYNRWARGHWGIENHLHWHLDVSFEEDACRARADNAPENLAVVRKLALQTLTAQQDKYSIKKRQYKAALDRDYMMELLQI